MTANPDATLVYDIEGQLESAITALFAERMTAYSSQSDPRFQKEGTRVECQAQLGSGKSNHLAGTHVTGLEVDVENAWTVNVTVSVMTVANITVHAAYRSLARLIMARLPGLVSTAMPRHVIYAPTRHMGSSPVITPEEGFYRTEMQYTLDICVHSDAWALL